MLIKTLKKNGSDEIMFSRGKINLCGNFGSYGTQAEHPYKADAKIQGCTIMVVLGSYYWECIDSNGDYANLEAYIPTSLVGSTIVHVSQYVLHTSNWCSCCHNQQGKNNCCRLANPFHHIPTGPSLYLLTCKNWQYSNYVGLSENLNFQVGNACWDSWECLPL